MKKKTSSLEFISGRREIRWALQKKVIAALGEKIDQNEYKVVAAGTTGSARKLVGAMCNASIVKNENHGTRSWNHNLHPDVRTILRSVDRIPRSSVWKTVSLWIMP